MRNQLVSPRSASSAVRPAPAAVLLLILVSPLLVIGGRVAQVQSQFQSRYSEPWLRTKTVERDLVAHNGRILTADGIVLAHDETEFALEAHYRWIESPPNSNWLRKEARARLTSGERRDADKVAAAEHEIVLEREAAWNDLLALVPDLAERREKIQRDVERIREVVLKKRKERRSRQSLPTEASTNVLSRIWHELTTPPKRVANDPLILVEEIGYHSLGTLPDSVVQLVLDRPTRFRGWRIAHNAERSYPAGELASHVIGFRGRPAETDNADSSESTAIGITSETLVGRAGVEKSYDRALRGRMGSEAVERRRDGLEVQRVTTREPRDGQDVVLTIDSRFQRTAEAALDDTLASLPDALGGVAILMDARTGALLAAASGPRATPSIYQHPTAEEWAAVRDDPRRPLFPRVTQMALPPGSVFKVISAMAALESGWDPEERIFCQGYFRTPDRERCALFRNVGYGHDRIAIDHALGVSCNVFFFEIAEAIGSAPLVDWAGRCGAGWETGIDLPGEKPGGVPRVDGFPYPGSVRQFGIGQGTVTTTPLQIARLTAAVANGGWLVQPHVVTDGDFHIDRLGVSESTLDVIQRGMALAVHGPSGTARSLASLPVRVAGKTGSAEVGGHRPSHAWFTGFFPLEAPRFVVTVAVEHGGSGGKVAAPIAGRLVEKASEIDPSL